jgi:alpha-amylase
VDGAPGLGGDEEIGHDSAAAVALNPNTTFVTMFKWRYNDVASECARFLGPNGVGGVQISPPNPSITTDTWWNMYQPTNYTNLAGNMGSQADLANMITACHNAGVRVYADVVLNQMTSGQGVGTDGASYDGSGLNFLGGITSSYFHSACNIADGDYNSNRNNVVNCRLVGLPDLATDTSNVRTMAGNYLNLLRSIGIDGYRFDAAKHMWPADIQAFLAPVSATTQLGEARFVTQEVIPDGTVNRSDYFINGTINEFQFTYSVRDAFRNSNGLSISQLPSIQGTGNGGGSWQLVPSANASVFVNNWDTERSANAGDSLNLTNDSGGKYDLANIYMLASPYGRANVESGFAFYHDPGKNGGSDVNAPSSSPYDASGNAVVTTSCSNSSAACGWDFVHRWSTIYPMVAFRNAAASQGMTNIQTGNSNQLAFGRGNVGFVALNNDSSSSWSTTFSTGLPAGTYCNVVHGLLNAAGTACASDSVTVSSSGTFSATIAARGGASISAIAIHTGQKVGSGSGGSVPAAPTGVTATATSSSAITVSWSASAGATSYTVYRLNTATGLYVNIGNTTGTSFGDTGLTGGTLYTYKLTASNTIGESAQSVAATATTSSGGAFASNFAHMYLRGTMNSWGTTAMTLVADHTWQVTTTLTASTAYQYKYDASGSWTSGQNWGDSSSPQDGTAEVNTGTNINLTTGAATSYVFSFNDSSLAYSVTACCGTAPATPTGLVVTAVSSSQLQISWTGDATATSYTILRSPTSTGTYVSVGTSTTTSFLNTGLSASTTYFYKITATNAYGTSSQSTAASATTSSAGFTSPWANMYLRGTMNSWSTTPMTLTSSNTWQVTVTLSPSTQYQFKFDASGSWTPNQNWGASSTSGFVQANTGNVSFTTGSGTSYIFQLNDSTLAYSVTSTTPTAPDAPVGVTATATSSSAITIAWSASSGATSYTVKRGTAAGGPYSTTVGTGLTGLSVGDSGLTASTPYYYVVTATNSAGTSGNSNEATATTQAAAGSTVTTLRVHYDVGPGNSISIRGSIAALNSWAAPGLAATWTAGNIWVYTTTAITSGTSFDFKALRNDNFWSDGANYSGTGGQTIDVTPTFNGNFYDTMDSIATNWTFSGWAQGTLVDSGDVTTGVAKCTGCTTSKTLAMNVSKSKVGTVTLGFKYSLSAAATGGLTAKFSTNGGSTYSSAFTSCKDSNNNTVTFPITASTSGLGKKVSCTFTGSSTVRVEFVYSGSPVATIDDVSLAVQ